MPALSALTEAFPDAIFPEHVSEEAFMWAAQLWYSYGMEVRGCLRSPFCTYWRSHAICLGANVMLDDPGNEQLQPFSTRL